MDIYISASIVLYKSDESVCQVIADFLHTNLNVKLYLIDNSPTNQLQRYLARFIASPRVTYIFNNANIGFGAGHNVAIQDALDISPFHLVLNPDVSFPPGTVEKLVAYMDSNKDVGLVMPRILYPNGKLQYACKLVPTPADLIFRRFLPRSITQRRMEVFELRKTGYDKEMEVPYLSGCFMLLRTEALKKVGLFDERFFMYPEDIDLTRRIHKEYKTMFYPYVTIVHKHEQGSYKSFKLLYIHIVNMIRYFNKWGWFFDRDRSMINKRILAQFRK